MPDSVEIPPTSGLNLDWVIGHCYMWPSQGKVTSILSGKIARLDSVENPLMSGMNFGWVIGYCYRWLS